MAKVEVKRQPTPPIEEVDFRITNDTVGSKSNGLIATVGYNGPNLEAYVRPRKPGPNAANMWMDESDLDRLIEFAQSCKQMLRENKATSR